MKNIYLVGFMATGKSSAGRMLAQRLKRDFVDMDALIESLEGMTIAQIFKTKGEPYFRRLEKETISDLAQKKDLVVSCGGGVFVPDDNIRLMKKSGVVFCLTSSAGMILKRASVTCDRPLLNVADPLGRIAELLAERQPFYAQAHYQIDADKLTVEETADAIREILRTYE